MEFISLNSRVKHKLDVNIFFKLSKSFSVKAYDNVVYIHILFLFSENIYKVVGSLLYIMILIKIFEEKKRVCDWQTKV